MYNFQKILVESPGGITRCFMPLIFKIDGQSVRLSIQGSHSHYCSPKKTLAPQDYTTMEVEICVDGQPLNSEILAKSNIDFLKRYKHIDKVLSGPSDKVAGWVPVNEIQRLCEYLMALQRIDELTAAPKKLECNLG